MLLVGIFSKSGKGTQQSDRSACALGDNKVACFARIGTAGTPGHMAVILWTSRGQSMRGRERRGEKREQNHPKDGQMDRQEMERRHHAKRKGSQIFGISRR